MVFNQASLY